MSNVRIAKPTKWQIKLREKVASVVHPTPVPQLGRQSAKTDCSKAEERSVTDTPLKSWIEGSRKIQERWISPDTKQFVPQGTPGAVKLRTEQEVTERAHRRYLQRAQEWRQHIPNWAEVLLDERALRAEEERISDAAYIQPQCESSSETELNFSREGSTESERSVETGLRPRVSKFRMTTTQPVTTAEKDSETGEPAPRTNSPSSPQAEHQNVSPPREREAPPMARTIEKTDNHSSDVTSPSLMIDTEDGDVAQESDAVSQATDELPQPPTAVAEIEIAQPRTKSINTPTGRLTARDRSPETVLEKQYKQELRRELRLSTEPVITVTLDSDGETEQAPDGTTIKCEPTDDPQEKMLRMLRSMPKNLVDEVLAKFSQAKTQDN